MTIDTDYDDPDEAMAEVKEVAQQIGQGDLAAFIDLMDERGYTDEDGGAEIEDLDEAELPLHGDERTVTVMLAFAAGAAIERKYSEHRLDNAEPATQPDEAGPIEETHDRDIESVQG